MLSKNELDQILIAILITFKIVVGFATLQRPSSIELVEIRATSRRFQRALVASSTYLVILDRILTILHDLMIAERIRNYLHRLAGMFEAVQDVVLVHVRIDRRVTLARRTIRREQVVIADAHAIQIGRTRRVHRDVHW